MMPTLATVIALTLLSSLQDTTDPYARPGALNYNRDIRPILAENCFACHGFDEKSRKGGLRLDRAEFAYAERDGITAIKPHDLEASEVWRRINSKDPDEVMPSSKSHRTLTEIQKSTIAAWIAKGAQYEEHWSLIAPVKATVPLASAQPIDAFVRQRLSSLSLGPAHHATAATLIRRVSFDLTGLPPTAEQATAFALSEDPLAYEQLVDRLLASPQFGERMALPWLDAARYADTNGFSIDGGRHAWLWRDYVINAFNTNKPYDRFLTEQLAGDLLPDKTDETITATGFERNSMVTHEGGTIDGENLVIYGADRVRTFGEAMLGLTLGCAQCHDHKFDPITQKDYYSLFAYFNTSSEGGQGGDGGVNAAPTANVQSVIATGEEDALRAHIATLEQTLANPIAEDIAAWQAQQREVLAHRGEDFALHAVKLLKISTPNTGSGFSIEDSQFALVERPMGFIAFDVSMEVPPIAQPITGLRVIMHASPAAMEAGWGWGGGAGAKKSFALTNLSVSAGTVPSDQVNLSRMIEASGATANSWSTDASSDNHPLGVLNTKASEAWIPDINHDGPVHLTLTFAKPLSSKDATHLTAQMNFGRHGDVTAKRMEFFVMTGRDDGSALPAALIAAIGTDASQQSAEMTARIASYFTQHSEALASTRIDLANARERLATRTEKFATLVMDTAASPRETFILNRGNYADPRDKVTVNTPSFLPPLPEGAPANRLGLAQWTTMPTNPLTARVAVNRFWQTLFGAGLVRTAADFGVQGDLPLHAQLLDWLAVDFVEHGWDVKRLIKMMVMSDTYRQSSETTPQELERDRDNRYLARGARFRLPAELIRDNALAVSGLLVTDLGGPSVNPYTPGDLWREISHYGSSGASAQSFHQDHGDKLYRRSMYTYWKRTQPPPNMVNFDAPNREVCTVDRANTNTPLQALVLLNDVQYVEAARAFAQRIMQQSGDDSTKLSWAFLQATARVPKTRETEVLARALSRERAHFAVNEVAARELLAHGESARDDTLPISEHAAWTQVASLLLNLSETVTRN